MKSIRFGPLFLFPFKSAGEHPQRGLRTAHTQYDVVGRSPVGENRSARPADDSGRIERLLGQLLMIVQVAYDSDAVLKLIRERAKNGDRPRCGTDGKRRRHFHHMPAIVRGGNLQQDVTPTHFGRVPGGDHDGGPAPATIDTIPADLDLELDIAPRGGSQEEKLNEGNARPTNVVWH